MVTPSQCYADGAGGGAGDCLGTMNAKPGVPGRRTPRRPLAFLIHSLLGLKLSLFTLFVCLTGTVAVVSDDLEWLYRAEVRAGVTDRPVSWERRYAAARDAYPRYTIDFATAGEAPYLATQFLATDPAGETRRIYVDPAAGRMTGESGWITLPSVLRALHYYLFVPGDWGFYAVTALGFVLMSSLVTGLLVYKKFWRGFFKVPRIERGARVFWGDLHRLVGLWSTWFVFVIAATSLWYLAERILYRADVDFETPRQTIDAAALDALGPEPPKHLPLDTLIGIAKTELPSLAVKEIWFPTQPDEPIWIRGQASAWLVRDRTNGVELNPFTGEVLAVHRAEGMPPVERWVHTADPLHFGDFGGLASKLVWVVVGLAMCLSAASGVVIYIKRAAQAAKLQPAYHGAPAVSQLLSLDFLGRWKWPNLLVVIAVPIAAYAFSWMPSFTPEGIGTRVYGPSKVGPWSAVIGTAADLPLAPRAKVRWHARFCSGCYAEIRVASLAFVDIHGETRSEARLSGGANSLSTTLATGDDPSANRSLKLIVEGWDNRTYVTSWKLSP